MKKLMCILGVAFALPAVLWLMLFVVRGIKGNLAAMFVGENLVILLSTSVGLALIGALFGFALWKKISNR